MWFAICSKIWYVEKLDVQFAKRALFINHRAPPALEGWEGGVWGGWNKSKECDKDATCEGGTAPWPYPQLTAWQCGKSYLKQMFEGTSLSVSQSITTLFNHPHTPGWHQVSRPYLGPTCTRVKWPKPAKTLVDQTAESCQWNCPTILSRVWWWCYGIQNSVRFPLQRFDSPKRQCCFSSKPNMHIQPTHTFCNLAFSVLRFDDPKLKGSPLQFFCRGLVKLGNARKSLANPADGTEQARMDNYWGSVWS